VYDTLKRTAERYPVAGISIGDTAVEAEAERVTVGGVNAWRVCFLDPILNGIAGVEAAVCAGVGIYILRLLVGVCLVLLFFRSLDLAKL
jgi:hypothetical protein